MGENQLRLKSQYCSAENKVKPQILLWFSPDVSIRGLEWQVDFWSVGVKNPIIHKLKLRSWQHQIRKSMMGSSIMFLHWKSVYCMEEHRYMFCCWGFTCLDPFELSFLCCMEYKYHKGNVSYRKCPTISIQKYWYGKLYHRYFGQALESWIFWRELFE